MPGGPYFLTSPNLAIFTSKLSINTQGTPSLSRTSSRNYWRFPSPRPGDIERGDLTPVGKSHLSHHGATAAEINTMRNSLRTPQNLEEVHRPSTLALPSTIIERPPLRGDVGVAGNHDRLMTDPPQPEGARSSNSREGDSIGHRQDRRSQFQATFTTDPLENLEILNMVALYLSRNSYRD